MSESETYGLFKLLFAHLQGCLSDAELAEVRAFFDVNELGLAFETVEDIFIDRGETPPPDVEELMHKLGKLMDQPYPSRARSG